jgi:hypothetical protein
MGLSFAIAAGPRQRSHSRVRVPRDSCPYFTVSDSRLPQPGGPGSRIYITRNKAVQLLLQALWSLFASFYYGGDIPSELSWVWVWVLCYDRRSVGQSASLSWNKAPIWGLRPDIYYCQIVAALLMWGSLSDERMGMPFTIAAGPRQRSHSGVRVPWEVTKQRPLFRVTA